LLAVAQRGWRELGCERSLVCVDAHMSEVYWAEFEVRDGQMAPCGDERLDVPSNVALPAGRGWAAVGGGFATYGDALAAQLAAAERVFAGLLPTAEDLFPQAARDLAADKAVAPVAALPVYLREHTAWRRQS
jgi:tRNA threonylcarbamoyladenosine biosynthesis protein TsaB